jgi:hypothetical protein
MPAPRLAPRGLTTIELATGLLLAVSLVVFVWARAKELSVDSEETQFRQHLAQARQVIETARAQALTRAGQGSFVVDGCLGHVDSEGNGTTCLDNGTAVTVANFNLTCRDGLGQATWFQQDISYQGFDATDTPGATMVMLTYAGVAGQRCVLSCTNGDSPTNPTKLKLRPDLGAALGVRQVCPPTLDTAK